MPTVTAVSTTQRVKGTVRKHCRLTNAWRCIITNVLSTSSRECPCKRMF